MHWKRNFLQFERKLNLSKLKYRLSLSNIFPSNVLKGCYKTGYETKAHIPTSLKTKYWEVEMPFSVLSIRKKANQS